MDKKLLLKEKIMAVLLKRCSLCISLPLLALAVIANITFLMFSFGQQVNKEKLIKTQRENALYRFQLDKMDAKLDELAIYLHTVEAWEDSVRIEKKLAPVNRELETLDLSDFPLVDSLSTFSNQKYMRLINDINTRLNVLSTRTQISICSHTRLIDYAKLQGNAYLYTPSIFPTFGRISAPYGWRKHPITGRRTFHQGIDIANKKGTPIYATANGRVRQASWKSGLGRSIDIDHENGYITRYGHLWRWKVSVGDYVKKGQVIALMGNTGTSTGNHVHYEVKKDKRGRNPWYYLNKNPQEIIIDDFKETPQIATKSAKSPNI